MQFGIPIPTAFLESEVNMKTIRGVFRFNQDIPGAIETVHPNKFLPNLRPVEDFRHTPVIPISEKDMEENRRKIEEKNRKGYYVEIRKDTLYFYSIAFVSLGIIFYTFLLFNDKNMRIKRDIERSRSLKTRAYRGRDGLSSTLEAREQMSMLSGNKKF